MVGGGLLPVVFGVVGSSATYDLDARTNGAAFAVTLAHRSHHYAAYPHA
jgi:hypothetical protein